MIDTKEVGLIQTGLEVGDQLTGGGEIVTKGFFDYNAGGKCRADETGFRELLDDSGKVVRSGGEIEDVLGEATSFG